MAVAIDRIARQPAHLEDVARGLAALVDQPFGRHAAHLLLVLVDHHHLVGVEDVVEGNDDDVVLVGKADDAVEAVWSHGDGDDRVEALVDEVLHRAELGRHVGPRRDDLELLDVLLDARLVGEGLRRLDHLNAPGIADETVDHRDAIRSGLLLPLEEFGLIRPRLEAGGIGARARHDLGAGKGRDRGQQQARQCEPRYAKRRFHNFLLGVFLNPSGPMWSMNFVCFGQALPTNGKRPSAGPDHRALRPCRDFPVRLKGSMAQ